MICKRLIKVFSNIFILEVRQTTNYRDYKNYYLLRILYIKDLVVLCLSLKVVTFYYLKIWLI